MLLLIEIDEVALAVLAAKSIPVIAPAALVGITEMVLLFTVLVDVAVDTFEAACKKIPRAAPDVMLPDGLVRLLYEML